MYNCLSAAKASHPIWVCFNVTDIGSDENSQ